MRLLSLLLLWLSLPALAQPNLAGHWEGTMVREGAVLPVSFDFAPGPPLSARFNSPTQRALGIPLRNVQAADGHVHFELVGDATTIVFDGAMAGRDLRGRFVEGSNGGTFALQPVALQAAPYREEPVRFRNGDVSLAGTLLIPIGVRRPAAVLFLHGSGGESRAGSRFLADHLARHGIAALIYDKRGVGDSTGDWRQAGFEELAADGAAGLELLAARPEIDENRIGIYGHSQGGMIAPLLATRSTRVAFVISGAGSAVPLYQAEINSITNQLRDQGIGGQQLEAARPFIARFVALLRTGQGRAEFEAETERVRAEPWYPMLHVPAAENWFWDYYRRIADYDASRYWQNVRIPSLLIYGERDSLVPLPETIAAADRALNRAGNRNYLILMLPRADHAFNIRPEPSQPFEWFRLAPGLPDLLVAWIETNVRHPAR